MKIKAFCISFLVCFFTFSISQVKAIGQSAVYVTDTVYVCDNSFPYVYGDTTFYSGTASGNYVVNKSHSGVVDSVVSLTLYVGKTYSVFDTLQLCQSDLPYQYGSMTVSATTPVGSHIRVLYLQTVTGCDSVVYLSLTILPSYSRPKSIQICSSELPYTFGGRVLTTAGTYRITLQTINGCDSVINLTLNINPSYTKYDTVKICPNSLPFNYCNRWIASAGDYRIDAATTKGCDSTIFLHLETYNYPMSYDTLYVCASALPYRYGNSYIPDQGSWDIPLVSQIGGCDSLVRVQLYTEPMYRKSHYVYVCSNDFPYVYGDKTIWDSGYYQVDMQSVYGCDSIIDLYVSVAEPHSVQIYDTVCMGDGYQKYGFNLPASATYLDRLTLHGRTATVFGCDSNITIHLTFSPIYNDTDNVTICETLLPYRKHGRLFTRTGDYVLHFQTVYGCDSIIVFRLRTTKVYNVEMTDHFCASDGSYKLGDSLFTESGDYTVVMSTKSGCDSVVKLHLVKDERAPYYPGEIYNKKDLYQTDKQTFWVSSVPNAFEYQWDYTNSAWRVEGSSNDFVLALRNISEGDTGTVSVKAVNACGVSQISSYTMGAADIAEYQETNVRAYPNPTDGQLYVETDNMEASSAVLFDITGRELQTVRINGGRTTVIMDSYTPGVYVLQIRSDRELLRVLRVVKQ